MPIKWDPALVKEALDRMEGLLQEAYPILEDAAGEGRAAARILMSTSYSLQTDTSRVVHRSPGRSRVATVRATTVSGNLPRVSLIWRRQRSKAC